MTIIEAIKSGKRFRRSRWRMLLDGPSDSSVSVTLPWVDLLADDWEVEDKKVEINRNVLINAWGRALRAQANGNPTVVLFDLAKELGLE